jgi:hypothetical protein
MPQTPATDKEKRRRRLSLRNTLLPQEHGGWAFVLNPILLALLVAPGWRGVLLGVAAVSAFLVHQPFKLWWKDYRVGRVIPRTKIARSAIIVYSAVAGISMGVVLATGGWGFLLPLALALPLAQIQLLYDARNKNRHLIPELCGAVALGAVGPAMTILGGWSEPDALLLWLLLTVWAVTSIFYVRVRLRLERNRLDDYDLHYAATVHGIGALLVLLAVYDGALPWVALLAVGVLAARAAVGLSDFRRPAKAIQVGVQEVVVGVVYIVLVAMGYAGWV